MFNAVQPGLTKGRRELESREQHITLLDGIL
jgi:hypothetical protein